jgi:hypothetical protein
MDIVESYMLCIDIFTTYIYVVTSGSFINLVRLLQIIFKMAGIRVYMNMKTDIDTDTDTDIQSDTDSDTNVGTGTGLAIGSDTATQRDTNMDMVGILKSRKYPLITTTGSKPLPC